MTSTAATSRYARLSPWQARAALLALAALIGAGSWRPPPRPQFCDPRSTAGKLTDQDLYRTEVERIHAGESYYQAAAAELPARGYPTASVLNWRSPLPIWAIGKLPDPLLGRLLLIAAGLAAMLLAYKAALREEPKRLRLAVPLVVALVLGNGALSARRSFPLRRTLGRDHDRILAGRIRHGTPHSRRAMALAVCPPRPGPALLPARPGLGPPPAAAAGVDGLYRRPGRLGRFLRAALLGGHALDCPGAMAHRQGWVRFGGLKFVLAATQANGVLASLPVWATAIYFALAMFGFAGWRTAWGTRIALAAGMYVAAFSSWARNSMPTGAT